MPFQWNIETLRVIQEHYRDCGHVPVEDGTADYYILYRPACLPGERAAGMR